VAGATEIGVLANTTGWRRSGPYTRTSEPGHIRTLPVIDNSLPSSSNVRTSVDCYVTGSYVQRNGQSLEVTQRYSVFVSYAKQTQYQTMKELNERVASDFQARYGGTFNVTTIFVPDIPTPMQEIVPGVAPGDEAPVEFYLGSRLFKGNLGSYQKMRLDVGKEATKERLNVQSIRKRFGYGRR
jgi:hypothetical protein